MEWRGGFYIKLEKRGLGAELGEQFRELVSFHVPIAVLVIVRKDCLVLRDLVYAARTGKRQS